MALDQVLSISNTYPIKNPLQCAYPSIIPPPRVDKLPYPVPPLRKKIACTKDNTLYSPEARVIMNKMDYTVGNGLGKLETGRTDLVNNTSNIQRSGVGYPSSNKKWEEEVAACENHNKIIRQLQTTTEPAFVRPQEPEIHHKDMRPNPVDNCFHCNSSNHYPEDCTKHIRKTQNQQNLANTQADVAMILAVKERNNVQVLPIILDEPDNSDESDEELLTDQLFEDTSEDENQEDSTKQQEESQQVLITHQDTSQDSLNTQKNRKLK